MGLIKSTGRQKRLKELEDNIYTGVMGVGESLRHIVELELYLETHDNLKEYAKERWGWSESHVYQMIKNAKTLENVSAIAESNTAKTLRNDHLKVLGKVPDESQADVAAEVFKKCEKENRTPTKADFVEAAKPFIEPEESKNGQKRLSSVQNSGHQQRENANSAPEPSKNGQPSKLKAKVLATAKNLMRMIDDLNDEKRSSQHPEAMSKIQGCIKAVEAWNK